MDKLVIGGGEELYGRLRIPAAKNSLLPLLAASAAIDGKAVFYNCPDLSDLTRARGILDSLGKSSQFEGGTLEVDGGLLPDPHIPKQLMSAMRGSLMFIGAALTAAGSVRAYMPGGCKIGARPIDIHLDVFRALGASVTLDREMIELSAPGGLKGARIPLRFCSVGATENAILAAVKARGETEILNAAREPEIGDLIDFLNRCGARIYGKGSSHLRIEGVKRLSGTEYLPISDRIVTATYMAAVSIAGGALFLDGARPEDMGAFINLSRDMGVHIYAASDGLAVLRRPGFSLNSPPYTVKTAPYPGFPTDCAPLAAAMMCCADGRSLIEEEIFEDRFRYCDGFAKLGAQTAVAGRNAVIFGGGRLKGAEVEAEDLRGGAALVCLALAAQGDTTISGIGYIDRGYERLDKALSQVGARIKRIQDEKEGKQEKSKITAD